MAKRKRKKNRKGKVPPHLKKYLFKSKGKRKRKKSKPTHHRKGTHMAKRKKRRSGGGKRRSHRRRHSTRGFGGGYRTDIELAIGGLAFGLLEKKAKEDTTFILNKLPNPIDVLGRTGNLTLATYLASYLVPGKFKSYLRTAARSGATITAYQMGRKAGAFKEGSEFFTVSGPEDLEQLLGDEELGEIEDELGRVWHLDAHIDDEGGNLPAPVEHEEEHVPA